MGKEGLKYKDESELATDMVKEEQMKQEAKQM
jgi:hypothetical protein